MYEAPRLERFGNFRELTQAKNTMGHDLMPAPGQGLNECDTNLGPAACRS
jgi:hypothetical protein